MDAEAGREVRKTAEPGGAPVGEWFEVRWVYRWLVAVVGIGMVGALLVTGYLVAFAVL